MLITLNAVSLRPIEHRDLELITRMRNDLTVEARSQPTEPLPTSRSLYEARLDSGISAVSSGDPNDIEFAITRADDPTGTIVGVGGIYSRDRRNRLAEGGVAIADPADRGSGIGFDTYLAMTRYSFQELECHKVMGFVKSTNTIAIRSLARIGFSHEGTLVEHRFEHGRRVDLLMYRMLASEWSDDLIAWREQQQAPYAAAAA